MLRKIRFKNYKSFTRETVISLEKTKLALSHRLGKCQSFFGFIALQTPLLLSVVLPPAYRIPRCSRQSAAL